MKKERGSITVLTLVTILFMLSFLISTFVIISNRRQAQAEIKRETKGIYEGEIENKEQIYQSYFAGENEVIPIYTAEELLKIGTGKKALINNKIYKLNEASNYKLMTDIDFKVADYISTYPDVFENTTWTEHKKILVTLTNQVTNFEYTGRNTNIYSSSNRNI